MACNIEADKPAKKIRIIIKKPEEPKLTEGVERDDALPCSAV